MPYVNPITQPYGDIAMMPTNKLDSAVNRIYAENKQREAKKAAELAAIDDDMNKEYGNIRSIDVPEFTEKWSKYKQLRQKVLYDKNLQKDPIAYQQAKRDADMALGEVYRHGNASKEVLQAEKNKDEWAKSHPYETSNDYDKHRLALRNTKVNDINNYQFGVDEKGQPIKRSLLDESLYVDNTPTYDWAKRAKEAEGVLNKGVYEERKALDKQGLQFEVVPYNYGATPEQFRLTLRSSLTDGDPKQNQSALKTASKLGAKISPQDYEAIQQQYLSIPPDELKRRGIKQLKPLPTPENDADRYINFATMQNALARNAVRGESREKDNEAAKMALQHKYRQAEQEYARSLRNLDQKEADLNLEKYVGIMEDDANKNGLYLSYPQGTNTVEGKEIKLSNDVATTLSINKDGKAIKSDAAILLPNGNWQAVVYKRTNPSSVVIKDADGTETIKLSGDIVRDAQGRPEVDMKQTYLREQVKANLNKYFAGKIPKQAVSKKGDNSQSGGSSRTSESTITGKTGKKLVIVE